MFCLRKIASGSALPVVFRRRRRRRRGERVIRDFPLSVSVSVSVSEKQLPQSARLYYRHFTLRNRSASTAEQLRDQRLRLVHAAQRLEYPRGVNRDRAPGFRAEQELIRQLLDVAVEC